MKKAVVIEAEDIKQILADKYNREQIKKLFDRYGVEY